MSGVSSRNAKRAVWWRRPGASPVVMAVVLAAVLMTMLTLPADAQRGPVRQGDPDMTESSSARVPVGQLLQASERDASADPLSEVTAVASATTTTQARTQTEAPRTPVTAKDVLASSPARRSSRAAEHADREESRGMRSRRPPAPVDLNDRADRSAPTRNTNQDDDEWGLRVWPVPDSDFTFTQEFGCVPFLGEFYGAMPGCPESRPAFHSGIDLAAPEGTRFFAAASGWVVEAGLDRATGLANTRILVQHDGPNTGFATEYLHWITTYVEPGDYVRAGEPLGEVGSVGYSTGPHLHFGVVDFKSDERIDPTAWLPRGRNTGVYRGRVPGDTVITFDRANVDLPDYADPAPAPIPNQRRVPASPPPNVEYAAPAVRETDQERGNHSVPSASSRDERAEQRANREARRDERNDAHGDDAAGDHDAGAGGNDRTGSRADDSERNRAADDRENDRGEKTGSDDRGQSDTDGQRSSRGNDEQSRPNDDDATKSAKTTDPAEERTRRDRNDKREDANEPAPEPEVTVRSPVAAVPAVPPVPPPASVVTTEASGDVATPAKDEKKATKKEKEDEKVRRK